MSKHAWLLAGVCIFMICAPYTEAIELCGKEAQQRMLAVGIAQRQITALCKTGSDSGRLMTIFVRRTEDILGYCRITLALRNDSVNYLNSLSLTTAQARFEIFRFGNILPGGTGFATGSSRSLLACDELGEVKVEFLWPGSVRVNDQPLQGRRLERYKPALDSPVLIWR